MKKRFISTILAVMLVATTMTFTGCSVTTSIPNSVIGGSGDKYFDVTVDIPQSAIEDIFDDISSTDKEDYKPSSPSYPVYDDDDEDESWAQIGPVTMTQLESYNQLSFIVDVYASKRSEREDLVEKAIATVLKDFGIRDSQVKKVQVTNPPVNGYNYVVIYVNK